MHFKVFLTTRLPEIVPAFHQDFITKNNTKMFCGSRKHFYTKQNCSIHFFNQSFVQVLTEVVVMHPQNIFVLFLVYIVLIVLFFILRLCIEH